MGIAQIYIFLIQFLIDDLIVVDVVTLIIGLVK